MAGQSLSASDGVENIRFAALANLLSLRNGGQLEPQEELDDCIDAFGQADDGDLDNLDDAGTNHPAQIAYSGHPLLKKHFLDRLSELHSRRKGGYDVVCSALREEEDGAQIQVTINTPFDEADKQFMEILQRLLPAISSATSTVTY